MTRTPSTDWSAPGRTPAFRDILDDLMHLVGDARPLADLIDRLADRMEAGE